MALKLSIYEEIRKDHRQIEDLFRRLLALDGSHHESRHRLVGELQEAWVSHARAEEAAFYNELRRLDILSDLVHESYQEHLDVETQLRLLRLRDRIETDWRSATEQLLESFLRHREEEENAVFSVAEEMFTDAEALTMGRNFLRLKGQYSHQGWLRSGVELLANVFDFKDPRRSHHDIEKNI